MTCNRYAYQLSLHLDGRLSSARREALLSHLTSCDSCQGLWSEMQKAQELALSLPYESVTQDFRESLFDRIRAGEGTPEAIFHEPVPKLVKLRYLATGAAAAAVILLGFNLAGAWPSGQQENFSQPAGTNEVLASGLDDEFRPFNATYVAEAGANGVTRSIDDLKFFSTELSKKIDQMPPHQLLREDAQLTTLLKEARGSVGLMRSMQEWEIISLPSNFAAELRFMESSLRQFESAENVQEFRFALEQLARVKVEHMRDPFQVLCCQNQEEFFALYSSMVERNPDIGRVLKVVAPQNMQLQNMEPTGGSPQGRRFLRMQFRISSGSPRGHGHQGPSAATEDVEIKVEEKRLRKQK